MLLNNNTSYQNPLQKYLKCKYLLFLILLLTILVSLVLIVLLISMDYMGFSSTISGQNSDIYISNSSGCKDDYIAQKYKRVDLRMKVGFISMLVQFVLIFFCIFIAFELSISQQKFYEFFDNLNNNQEGVNIKHKYNYIMKQIKLKSKEYNITNNQNNEDPQYISQHIIKLLKIVYIFLTISILLVSLTFGIYLEFFIQSETQKNTTCSISLNKGRIIAFFSLAAAILLLLSACLTLTLRKLCRIKAEQQIILGSDDGLSEKDHQQNQNLLLQIKSKKLDSDEYLANDQNKNTDRRLLQKQYNKQLQMPIISQIELKNGSNYQQLLKEDLFDTQQKRIDKIKQKQIQDGILPYNSYQKQKKPEIYYSGTNKFNPDESKSTPYRYPPTMRSKKKLQQQDRGQKIPIMMKKYQKVLNSIDLINQKQRNLQYEKQLRQKNLKLKEQRPGNIKSIQQRVAQKKAKQARQGSSPNLPINARSIVYQRSSRSYSNSNNSSEMRDSRSRQKQDFTKQVQGKINDS